MKKKLSIGFFLLTFLFVISCIEADIVWQSQDQNTSTPVKPNPGVEIGAQFVGDGWNWTSEFDISGASTNALSVTTNMTSWDDGCCFFFVDTDTDDIMWWDTSGTNVKNVAMPAEVSYPRAIWTNASGEPVTDFWVSDDTDDYLYHYSADGTAPEGSFEFSTASAGTNVQGVTSNITSGEPTVFYTVDSGTDKISEWTVSGTNTRNYSLPAAVGLAMDITTNETDKDPDFFILTDDADDELYLVDTSGNVIDNFDTGVDGLTLPSGVTVFKGAGALHEVVITGATSDKLYRYQRGFIEYAILSTNETGTWENKTAYGSPKYIGGIDTQWTNFSWSNDTVANGTYVAWKIYANNTRGEANVTNEMTFQLTQANSAPTASNLTEPADPATYLDSATHQFNFTAGDADGLGNIDMVIFEWDGTNSTNITTTHPINSTHAIFYTSRTDEPVQSSTTYKFYVNDTSNEGASVSGTFTINKAAPTIALTLDGDSTSSQTRTYPNATNIATSESNSVDADCSYALKRNGTATSDGAITLGVENYNFTYSIDSCTNFTDSQTEIILTINKGTPAFTLTLDGDSTASQSRAFPNATNIQSSESNSVDTDCTYQLYQNNSAISNGAITLAVEKYNLTYAQTATCTNFTTAQVERILTVTQNTSTSDFMTLLLDGTAANETVVYGNTSNATAYNDTSVFDSQSITFTLYRNDVLIGTNGLIEDRLILGNATHNYTYNTSGNANYSRGQKDFSVLVEKNTTGTIKTYNINDTYINFNESVRITVNASSVASVIIEITKPSETKNYTMTWNGSFYNYDLTKTDLGDISTNASHINITTLYFGGTNYTDNSNTTGTLNFTYGIANATSYGDAPDPITNAAGQAIEIWFSFADDEATALRGSCTATIDGSGYSMSYDTTDTRYEVLWSTTSKAADTYAYHVNCTNTSYQNVSVDTQWFTVQPGVTGGTGGGGGGDDEPPVKKYVNFTVTPEKMILTSPSNKEFIAKALNRPHSFMICNGESENIQIDVEFFGTYTSWATLDKVSPATAIAWFGVDQIDFLVIGPLECIGIDVKVSVPDMTVAPIGDYDIGIKFSAINTDSEKESIITLNIGGLGLIKDILASLFDNLAFGFKSGPEYDRIHVCKESAPAICAPGKLKLYIPFINTALSIVVFVLSLRFFNALDTFKKSKRIPLVLAILIGIVIIFAVPMVLTAAL